MFHTPTSMAQVDFLTLQTHLPHFLEQVEKGKTFVVYLKGKPVAELRPVHLSSKGIRPLGLGVGQGEILPGFFEPLPEDLIAGFSGEKE